MVVYEFEKSLLSRMSEISDVLGSRGPVPASAVRTEWANYVEIAIEPTGWQALWRIPRVVCEDLSIKFPTFIMGTVDQVLFDELKALFLVEAVQDDDVHLPEKVIVALEELWPLKEQENDALNVDRTADCVDRLRFFYQHVWMPWDSDNDDDQGDWTDKHLEGRIKFYYDVKNKTMSKRLSSHVLALLAEANYIQKKRELLEMEIEEEEENEDEPEKEEDLGQLAKASDLMKLHLRLNSIKNEIEILENPAMRDIYEKVRFSDEHSCFGCSAPSKEHATEAFMVTHIGTLEQQIDYLNKAKAIVGRNKIVQICDSLQGALEKCKPSDELFLPPGRHVIKFLEYLNSGGSIRAISSVPFLEACQEEDLVNSVEKSIISSKDDDSILITVDGDYCFENVVLDCSNVRTGVLAKRGNITFKNCCFIGDPKSTTKQGIVVFGNSTIRFEHCVIKDFSTGIYANHNCKIQLIHSTIQGCISGIELLHGCSISFDTCKIKNCKSYGVLLEVDDLNVSQKEDRLSYDDYNQIERKELTFRGACEFHNNGKSNFIVFNGNDMEFNSSCFTELPASGTPESNNPGLLSNVSSPCLYDSANSDMKSDHSGSATGLSGASDTDPDDEQDQVDATQLTDEEIVGSDENHNVGILDEHNLSKINSHELHETKNMTANGGASFDGNRRENGEDSLDSVFSGDYVDDSIAVIEIDDTVIEID